MRQPRNDAAGDVVQLMSDICTQAGMKLSRQQVEVLREVAHSEGDPTAEKIHLRLRSRLPKLSRRAVRETLKELQRFGIIHKVAGPDEVVKSKARASSAGGRG